MVIRARAVAFALAPTVAAAGLALTYATVRPFGGAFLYFPLTAVIATSLIGGFGPGVVTLALSLLGFDYLFLHPVGRLGIASAKDLHRFMEFALAGLAGAWLCGRYRAARLAAEEAAAEARRVGHLQERLVAVVSHDLNNPLAAIRMGLEMMRKLGPLDARQHAVMARLQTSARRMERLVGDLLGFARTRRGRGFPIRRSKVSLGEVCETVVEECRQVFPGRVIQLSVSGDDEAALDPARLEQVAANLISNAIKHGDPGQPVDVTVAGSSGELVMSVTNRGRPIPRDVVPRIFEPFWSGNHASEGLGLGLFVVKGIVEAHGGSVTVRSDSRATALEVRLPRSSAGAHSAVGDEHPK